MEQDALHIHCFSMGGIPREGPAEPPPGSGEVPLRGSELAPGHQRFHLLGILLEGLAQMRLRLRRPALFPLQQGQVDPSRNQIRPQLDSPKQSGFCMGLAPLFTQQAPQIHPGSGKVRAQNQRPPVTAFGLFQLSQPRQHKPGCKLTLGQPWPQPKRLFVALQRLLIASQHSQRVTQTQMPGNQPRLSLDGQLKLPCCFLRTSGGNLQLAQSHPGQCVHAVQMNGLAVGQLSVVVSTGSLQRLAQRDPRIAHLRRNIHGRGGHLHRCRKLVACQRNQAHAHQRLGLPRVLLKHGLIADRNLGQPAGQANRGNCFSGLDCHSCLSGSPVPNAQSNRADPGAAAHLGP